MPLEAHTVADNWMHGVATPLRDTSMIPDATLIALLAGLFALICWNARHVARLAGSLKSDLLGTRRRSNVFDDHTASETRTLLMLVFLACLSEAIILSAYMQARLLSSLAAMGVMTALTAGLYIFRLSSYATVGYTFTDGDNLRQWTRAFNMTQGVLGVMLLIPALVALFNHGVSTGLFITTVAIYIVTRLFFIYKGFRIFYNGFSSLVYFILYLCALEIIPLIFIYNLAGYFSESL